MKNKNIILGQVVPPEIRLECYKEAKEIIQENGEKYDVLGGGLCLMLPCILWGLKHYIDDDPNDHCWDHGSTPYSFPEIAEFELLEKIQESMNSTSIRLKFLDWAIKQLEP